MPNCTKILVFLYGYRYESAGAISRLSPVFRRSLECENTLTALPYPNFASSLLCRTDAFAFAPLLS